MCGINGPACALGSRRRRVSLVLYDGVLQIPVTNLTDSCDESYRSLRRVPSDLILHTVFQSVDNGIDDLGDLLLYLFRGIGERVGYVGSQEQRKVVQGVSDAIDFAPLEVPFGAISTSITFWKAFR